MPRASGNCYTKAFEIGLDWLADIKGVSIIHGIASSPMHSDYGHAWCEYKDIALDLSGGRIVIQPKAKYRKRMGIKYAVEYTSKQIAILSLKEHCHGPYDKKIMKTLHH
jgi:hypothetical protein